MGSCFKNIFNRKKDTYYFVHPYSSAEGSYQTKDQPNYQVPTNDIISTKVNDVQSSPPPPKIVINDDVVKEQEDKDVVQQSEDDDHQDVNKDSEVPGEPMKIKEEESLEDHNENEIITPQTHDVVFSQQVSDDEEVPVQNEDVDPDDDITSAIAEVVDQAKAISEEDLNAEYVTEMDADHAPNEDSSKQDEIIREEVLAVERHDDEAISPNSVDVTVVQADYSASSEDVKLPLNPSNASSRSSGTDVDSVEHEPNEQIPAEIPESFKDQDDETLITETVEEFREPTADGGVTIVTVTTTEVTQKSAQEEDEEDDTIEPSIALLNLNSGMEMKAEEDIEQTTTSIMVNGGDDEQLPNELRDLDNIDSNPPSPSVVHINTPFPVHD